MTALASLLTRSFHVPSLSDLGRSVDGWLAISRQRAALARLDRRMLADVGLTRRDAAREAARPFWDIDANWRI